VAAPISWAELDDPELDARRWTLATISERLADDPWGETLHHGHGHGLAEPRRRLAHPNGT
jgi:bifunctional non-homologous end joining protein LigD